MGFDELDELGTDDVCAGDELELKLESGESNIDIGLEELDELYDEFE